MNAIETPAIQKTPNVCGGKARIRDTRIAVWLLVLNLQSGRTNREVLDSYPTLTEADLDAAWNYYRDNPVEIERWIWLNDVAGNVPDDVPPPAAVIVAGAFLGLDEGTIRDAFDPPLLSDTVAAAWAEYRAHPLRVGRDLADLCRKD